MTTLKAFRLIVLLVINLSFSISPQGAQAQSLPTTTFRVNTFADLFDDAPNNLCGGRVDPEKPVYGPCSLRSAIYEAGFTHGLPPRFIHIILEPGTYTFKLNAEPFVGAEDVHFGDLDLPDFPEDQIANEVLIEGSGGPGNPSIIDANNIERVFEIGENRRVKLKNLVIKNGITAEETPLKAIGGGIYVREGATLELENVHFRYNTARCYAEATCGYSKGGAIYSDGADVRLLNVEMDYSVADYGSAVYFRQNQYGTAEFVIENSSLHDNWGEFGVIEGEGNLFLINSTMSENITRNVNYPSNNIYWFSTVWIQNSTLITKNPNGNVRAETLNLRNSILLNASVPQPATFKNCLVNFPSEMVSYGGNIFSDMSCTPAFIKRDLLMDYGMTKLGILEDYGGFTSTVALLEGSPAIDRVLGKCIATRSVSGTLTDVNLATDQRGRPRSDAFCDAGAFEGDGGSVPTFLPVIRK